MDWRVRPLVLFMKKWARFHDINDASKKTISSYSLCLMVIHYLQCKKYIPTWLCNVHVDITTKYTSIVLCPTRTIQSADSFSHPLLWTHQRSTEKCQHPLGSTRQAQSCESSNATRFSSLVSSQSVLLGKLKPHVLMYVKCRPTQMPQFQCTKMSYYIHAIQI